MTKLFSRESLLELICHDSETLELIYDKLIDSSRWSLYQEIVFKDTTDNKFYKTTYSTGATEMQNESPWQYEEKIECFEVRPVDVTVIEYKEV